jgi:hypothetical protein
MTARRGFFWVSVFRWMERMDNNIVVGIGLLISNIFILIYYLDKKKSKCYDCKSLISHHKKTVFKISVEGNEYALCKYCYKRRVNTENVTSLPKKQVTFCVCCRDKSTAEVQGSINYPVCHSCLNSTLESLNKLKYSTLEDVFDADFIKSVSLFNNIDELIKSSNVEIKKQGDLDSDEWNYFIKNNTNYSSWKKMKKEAELKFQKNIVDQKIKKLTKDFE